MSIQQSINQGITAAAALYTQTPGYEQKKAEAAEKREIKQLKTQIENISPIREEGKTGEAAESASELVTELSKKLMLKEPTAQNIKNYEIEAEGLEEIRKSNILSAEQFKRYSAERADEANKRAIQQAQIKAALKKNRQSKKDRRVREW